ncbi:MAG: hypothetical protein ACI9E1_001760 [Cryomorphaceae bacterium]|jgi:hypothetical protein
MTVSKRRIFELCLIFFTTLVCSHAKQLPIYIEDSHAGSFGFFAQTLDLEKSYTLVLIDEHSDASGVPGSDRVRTALRKVASVRHRKDNVDRMRKDGTIQPFNWIEPLMPRPISKVIWIAGESLTVHELAVKQKEARIHLDWHTQAEKRKDGMLAERYEVTDWERFKERIKQGELGDVVVSIDLDYFVAVPNPTKNLKEKWDVITQWEGLEAVSFALSMPWQKDKKSADELLHTAFERAFSVEASDIQFEPYLTDLNDRSEMAKSYYQKGLKPPRYKIDQATAGLRKFLVRKQSRLRVTHNPLGWEALLRKWGEGSSKHELEVRTAQKSIDHVWRLRHDQLDDILLKSTDEEVSMVKWWLHRPAHRSYNIIPKSELGKGFASNAPAYVVCNRSVIAETQDLALSSRTWRKFLHTDLQIGIVKIQAELVTKNGSVFTDVIEIRVRRNEGFIGALEEQFGSPYVFGIGSYKQAEESGPETLLGNDCANFLIYAMRRNGKSLRWCNPAQIRQFIEPREGEVKTGDIVHLGSHVAVLYEDKGRNGILDGEDVLVHHLSGFPMFITLDKLAKGKSYTVLKPKEEDTTVQIIMGGDVCLHDKLEPKFMDLAKCMFGQLVVANLECVISDEATALKNKRFQFIVPKKKARGISLFTLLSLANNHAGDGGGKGLNDTMNYLEGMGVQHFGAGTTKPAAAVKILELNGQKIGFLGMNMIESDVLPATKRSIGVATYPVHQKEILASIKDARGAGVTTIIAMPHWGDEYTTKVNQQQRDLAQWLVRNDVDIVVGSHPHILQHKEYYRGKLIVYSLGNLIFAPQKRPGFNSRNMLLLSLTQKGELKADKLIKVK